MARRTALHLGGYPGKTYSFPVATSYTITPSGGVTLGGNATYIISKVLVPSGGVVFAGTGAMSFTGGGTTYTISPTGGITFAGVGVFLKGKVIIPSGGVILGGAFETIETKIIPASGGVVFGGTGSMTSNTDLTVGITRERTKVGVGT